ncbi:MAG: hypothetical protein ACRC62_26915 [Microcoleus sp.]
MRVNSRSLSKYICVYLRLSAFICGCKLIVDSGHQDDRPNYKLPTNTDDTNTRIGFSLLSTDYQLPTARHG